MSPRLRAALYAQAGAVFSLHLCLYAGDRPTAGRSRFATLLPGDAAVSPSNGDHAGTQRADPPPPRNGPKHRGAGRSRSATGPPRQSRSTRQFFCAEVLVAGTARHRRRRWLAWIGAGALLLAIGLGWYLLPLGSWSGALRERVVGLGWLGVAVFAACYIGAVVLLAPGALLTI